MNTKPEADWENECAVCGHIGLQNHTESRVMSKDGARFVAIGLVRQICPDCGTSQVSPTQMRHNKRIIVDARRQSLGLLPSWEITRIRSKLKLTQQEASKLFGGGPNSFNKYENCAATQSESIDRILRFLEQNPRDLVRWRQSSRPPVRVMAVNFLTGHAIGSPSVNTTGVAVIKSAMIVPRDARRSCEVNARGAAPLRQTLQLQA